MLLAAGVGVLIGAPVLRLRGDYLAIVTLGLGEMVRLISSNWSKPLVGGPQGMRNITDAEVFGLNFRQPATLLLPRARVRRCSRFSSRGDWRRPVSAGRGTRCARTSRSPTPWGSARRIQAARVRHRRRGGLAGRRAVRGQHRVAHAGELRDHRVDHGARRRDPRRHREHPGVVVGALVLIGLPGLLREFEEYRL